MHRDAQYIGTLLVIGREIILFFNLATLDISADIEYLNVHAHFPFTFRLMLPSSYGVIVFRFKFNMTKLYRIWTLEIAILSQDIFRDDKQDVIE